MAAGAAKTVDAYIAALEPFPAALVEELRRLLRQRAPDLEESVAYGTPKFVFAGTYLFAGAWKAHLGLYPVHPASDPALEAAIAPYRSGKDTVKLLYKNPIPWDLVMRIVEARIGAG